MKKTVFKPTKKLMERLKQVGIQDPIHDIDWGSYSTDISPEEWLNSEYGIILKSLKQGVQYEKAQEEKYKAEREEQQKIEEERLFKKATLKVMIDYKDVTEITESPKFNTAKKLIKLVIKGKKSAIIHGKAGIGKSIMVRYLLEDSKVDYAIMTTKTTYIDLLRFIWENKNKKVCIFEDVWGLWVKNDINSLFRQITDYDNKEVDKGTPDYRCKDIDQKFEIKFNAIIITNSIKNENSDSVTPILDRCYKAVKIELSNTEMVLLFKVLIKKFKLTEGEEEQIIRFIQQNSNEATKMSFRTLDKILEIYQLDRENWQSLALHELERDETKSVFLETKAEEHKTVSKEYEAFKEKAQKKGLPNSRATYFRIKNEMKP